MTLDLKSKDAEIAKASEGASEADARAGAALTAQEGLQVALSEQQEKTAIAEKDLLELRERIKPRRLTDQQSASFVNALKAFPNGEVKLGYTAGREVVAVFRAGV